VFLTIPSEEKQNLVQILLRTAPEDSWVNLSLHIIDCQGADLLFCLNAHRSKVFYRFVFEAACPVPFHSALLWIQHFKIFYYYYYCCNFFTKGN